MRVILHTVVFKLPGANDAFFVKMQEHVQQIREDCQVISLNFGPTEGKAGDFTHMLTLITRNKETLAKYTDSKAHQDLKACVKNSGFSKGVEAYDVWMEDFPQVYGSGHSMHHKPDFSI